jgi:hypothetical protein
VTFPYFLLFSGLLTLGFSNSVLAATNGCDYIAPDSKTTRSNKTIRLGGYFYTGKMDQNWYASNYDLLDLNAKNDPQLIATLKQKNPDLKVFQQFLTNQIAIKQTGAQAVEGFDLERMNTWLLRDEVGKPVHPRGYFYLMMKMSPPSDWPMFFATSVDKSISSTESGGIVLDEVPLRKSGMFNSFSGSMSSADWRSETKAFLRTLRSQVKVPVLINAGELSSLDENGRALWETFSPEIDGAWHEGWVRYYGEHNSPHTDASWEWDIRSAEEFSASNKHYIAAPAFSNRFELEYAVANYLLAVRGKSLVFQPMVAYNPATRGGFNFEIAQRAVIENLDLFDAEMGCALGKREKHGEVWLRRFRLGISLVNPSNKTISVPKSITGNFVDTRGATYNFPAIMMPFEGKVLYNSNKSLR